MGPAADPHLTRARLALPDERAWGIAEHSDGVFFAESARGRIGPLPAEAAQREADRQNEYELLLTLADALLSTEGGPELTELATESRFAPAYDPLLGAAITVLYEHGDYDEYVEAMQGPVVRLNRFVGLLHSGGVVVRECDSPRDAEDYFANWPLRELSRKTK